MNINRFFITAVITVSAAMMLTGCGERVNKETEIQTQAVTETEAVTEQVITEVRIETQPATETEKVTEIQVPQTETQPVTEVPENLTPEEEMAQETPLAAAVTYFAADTMNVRETPSTENNDNVFYSYQPGDEVTVVGKTPHWYKVDVEGTPGYVFKDLISETIVDPGQVPEEQAQPAGDTAQQSAPAPAAAGMIRIASAANVRSDATETASVLGVVNAGDELPMIADAGSWYQVDYNGQTGFVNKNLVE